MVGVIGHFHPSGANMDALVNGLEPYQRLALMGMSGHAVIRMFAQSGRDAQLLEGKPYDGLVPVYPEPHGSEFIYRNAPGELDAIRGLEINAVWHDEMEGQTMDETEAPPPQAVPTDPAGTPPRALSNNMAHRHFHPSYMRVGVRIDGVERNDLKWFDADAGQAITTGGTMISSEAIEPFWRYAESRQMRRARERWEKAHPGWTAKRTASQS